jgi:SAM-dependent methyltransferase
MSAQVVRNEYALDNAWTRAQRRLAGLEEAYDPGTMRRLAALAPQPGWTCLEAGAGSGSIARWLAGRVGPDGTVVAADIDTSLLVDLPANVEARRLDLRADPLPESAFDVVHARLLLCHLPEREEVLDKLVAALRPGGWLLLEDGDVFATEAQPWDEDETVHYRVSGAFWSVLGRSADVHLGGKLPAMARRRGLTDVSVECEVPFGEGGTPGTEWLRLTFEQLGAQAGGEVVDAPTLPRWHELMGERGRWFPTLALVATTARRPR